MGGILDLSTVLVKEMERVTLKLRMTLWRYHFCLIELRMTLKLFLPNIQFQQVVENMEYWSQ